MKEWPRGGLRGGLRAGELEKGWLAVRSSCMTSHVPRGPQEIGYQRLTVPEGFEEGIKEGS